MTKTIRRSVRSARSSFAGESGMSIVQVMAGIILTAVIAAAGVFATIGVLNWGQDNAAKTALEDVRTSQEIHLVDTASDSTGGSYGDLEGLKNLKLIEGDKAVDTEPSANGKDYVAAAKSKTGEVFVITSSTKEIVNVKDAGSLSAEATAVVDAVKAK